MKDSLMRQTPTLDEQIAVARSELFAARTAHEDAALQASRAPTNSAAQADVLAVEQEIAEAQAKVRRLEAAQAAAGRAAVILDKKAAAELHASRCAQVKKLSAEITVTAEAAARHLDELAPLLARLRAAGDERQHLGFQVLRAGMSSEGLIRDADRLGRLAGTESAGSGLLGALLRSKVGQAPGLSSLVRIQEPSSLGDRNAYTTAKMVENLGHQVAVLDDWLGKVAP